MENTLEKVILNASSTVKTIEEKAKYALAEENNSAHYRELMREKAEYLALLFENTKSSLINEPDLEKKKRVESTLRSFSKNATTALQLNSIFYMSALLYPDNYKEGEPNNLDLLAQFLQK